MFPQDVPSNPAVPSPFLPPQDIQKNPKVLIAYEMGGVGLQNPSQGLQVQVWKAEVIGDDVWFSAPNTPPTLVYSEPGITEITITFDQNMQPAIAYMVNYEVCKFRWFDGTISQFVVTTLPAGSFSPRCSMDDKRAIATGLGWNDIILTYIRGGTIYFRKQRDRYTIEYTFATGFPAHILGNFGMNLKYRLQWQVIPVAIMPGVPVLTSISPNSALQGDPGFFLTLNGSGFDSTSKVKWNGSIRETHWKSPTKMTAEITDADLATDGVFPVTVFTPLPGGGTSGSVPFTVVAQFQRLTEDGDTRITEAGDVRVTEDAP